MLSGPGGGAGGWNSIVYEVLEVVSLWGTSLGDDRRFQVQLIVHEMDWEYHCP